MNLLQLQDLAAVSVSIIFFALGSYFDIKTREVSDKVWLLYGPIGATLTTARVVLEPPTLILTLESIGLTTVVSLGLFYLGLFGGADAKAIICLGLTIPLPPTIFSPIIGYLHPFFPVAVVILGFVLSISVAIWLGARNLLLFLSQGPHMFDGITKESAWRKFTACISGYPANPSHLTTTNYLYPMEKIVDDNENAHREFHLFYSAEVDREKMISEYLEKLPKVGSPSRVWVSPGLPMLVFITLGIILTLILGDAVFGTILLLSMR
jgi:preflagellin peptidase FlaK